MYRIGFGFDVHQLKKGYPLFIGGVLIPSNVGAVGHSDADVLIHAICDALLGSLALKDIGHHFPDTSHEFKNIDSKLLLTKVIELVKSKGYHVGNIDTTVCLEAPKIAEYIDKMTEIISKILCIDKDRVSVKATTTEKLGYTGRGEGIAAYCVALLYSN